MPNLVPLINGKAYEWSDISLVIMGVPIAGITAIEYEETQEMQDNYGAGNYAVSRGYGQIKFSGRITLHAEEVEALRQIAPNGRLQAIPEFDIIVAYLPETGNIVTHKLEMVRFKNNARSTKAGDMTIEVQLELQIGNINWNA